MFEVAVCWFVSVLMGRKCQVAESFCPPCPCNWHFPCFVSLKYLQMQLRLAAIFFIHHKILNVNPAGKTPGHPKLSGRQQSFHFTIIHHRSVNKAYFLRIEPDQQSNSHSPDSTKKKGCDLTAKDTKHAGRDLGFKTERFLSSITTLSARAAHHLSFCTNWPI